MDTTTDTDRAEIVEEAAENHLRGIEGGLAGALVDLRAGRPIDEAAGLGGEWQLPAGISRDEVEEAVRRLLRETVRDLEDAQADWDLDHDPVWGVR